VAEKDILTYYKMTVKELSESNDSCKSEIDYLLYQNQEYQKEITELKQELHITKRDRDREYAKLKR
jgi:FtsZ-binding cell division protein ZapB